MIVVCYRPDPTQIVDEKLKFVEASFSKRRSFSPKGERFPASLGPSSAPSFSSMRNLEILYTTPSSSYHRHAFPARLRDHVSLGNHSPFDPSGARGELFGSSKQFSYRFHNVIPVSEDTRGHSFFLSSHRVFLGEYGISSKKIHLTL